MAKKEHLEILRQGIDVWNRWRRDNPTIRPDLSQAALREADLRKANLRRAYIIGGDLARANLSEADLSNANCNGVNLNRAYVVGADLTETNLHEANLKSANLIRGNFGLTDLRRADLSGTDLRGANFRLANLRGADLKNSILHQTSFNDVDLSSVLGLETVRHLGPSFIDIHTIYHSEGKIPEIFLRGTGVPDVFIEYMGSLVGKAVEYYSCFISYSSHDQPLAERIHADLQNNGVRCWYAPHDLSIGERIRVGIDEAIRFHDKLLLILSQDSVGSDWVEREVETAMEKERGQGQLVLFPIRIDDTAMNVSSGWAAHIRQTRNIGDFCKWKNHDAYQEVFQRLLRDLKTDKKAPTPVAVFTEPHRPHQDLELDEERIKLKNILVEHFNASELKDLYYDLNVDYENMLGETKGDKARELVAYFERHRPGGAATLAEYVRDRRPNAFANRD